jgi:hypothetical protein
MRLLKIETLPELFAVALPGTDIGGLEALTRNRSGGFRVPLGLPHR